MSLWCDGNMFLIITENLNLVIKLIYKASHAKLRTSLKNLGSQVLNVMFLSLQPVKLIMEMETASWQRTSPKLVKTCPLLEKEISRV